MAWIGEQVLTAMPESVDCVTLCELAQATGLPKKKISIALGALTRRGYVTSIEPGCYARTRRGDAAVAEGRRVRSGPQMKTGPKPRRDSLRLRAWAALRTLKKATLPEILELACRGDEKDPFTNVRPYLRALEDAGVVTRLGRKAAGLAPTSNGFDQWLLVKDIGEKAPTWDRNAGTLYDPNAGCYLGEIKDGRG